MATIHCLSFNILWHIFFLGLKSIITIVLKMKGEVRKSLPLKGRECISYFKMTLTGSAGIRGQNQSQEIKTL